MLADVALRTSYCGGEVSNTDCCMKYFYSLVIAESENDEKSCDGRVRLHSNDTAVLIANLDELPYQFNIIVN